MAPHHTGSPPPSCWATMRAVDNLQRDQVRLCDNPLDLELAGRWSINWLNHYRRYQARTNKHLEDLVCGFDL